MQKKKSFFPVFVVLLIFSFMLFLLSRNSALNGVVGFFEQGTIPIQRAVFGFVRARENESEELSRLKEENLRLTQVLVKDKKQEQDINALRDQFETATISSKTLLPAAVLGISQDQMILDKGENDGVFEGAIVVVKDNLVGRVRRVSGHIAVVELLTSEKISLTAKKIDTGSIGVVKGVRDGVSLENVVLSEKIKKGDLILTKGNVDVNGQGFPPDLIIGKVATVNKKASNLFQSAEIKSLLDFGRLTMVFVIVR